MKHTAILLALLLCAGCGSTAGIFRPAGSGDYLYQKGDSQGNDRAQFAVWPPEVKEVVYSIDTNNSPFPGVTPDKAVQAGVNDWGPVLLGRLAFIRVDPSQSAVVRIHWGRHGFLNGGSLIPEDIGDTVLHFGPRRFTVVPAMDGHAAIMAQEIRSAEVWLDRGLPPYSFRNAASHEWGHVLGVEFHSDRDGNLMFSVIPLGSPGPRPQDKNTVRAIYGLP